MPRILKDLFRFIRHRPYLAPVIIILVLLGLIMILGESSALAPFIYTVF